MKTLKEKRMELFKVKSDLPLNLLFRLIEKQEKECFKDILDEIEVAITSEKECMKRDKYSEQEVEHLNQIEMANKIIKIIKQNSGFDK